MMDNEMIERCAKAVRARDTQDEYAIVREVVKAMREPTQAQYDALCATNKIWLELDSLTVWQTYIDAIIND